MQQTIIIDIAPDGTVTIDAIGYTGTACTDATAFIEQALGTVQHRNRKPEYHQTTRRQNQQRLRPGDHRP
jgi:hypothetical protein